MVTTLAIGRTAAVAHELLRVGADAARAGMYAEIRAVASGIWAANTARATVEIALNAALLAVLIPRVARVVRAAPPLCRQRA